MSNVNQTRGPTFSYSVIPSGVSGRIRSLLSFFSHSSCLWPSETEICFCSWEESGCWVIVLEAQVLIIASKGYQIRQWHDIGLVLSHSVAVIKFLSNEAMLLPYSRSIYDVRNHQLRFLPQVRPDIVLNISHANLICFDKLLFDRWVFL